LIKKTIKLLKILRRWTYIRALFHNVAAAVEHERVLKNLDCGTVIDIGANKGQFALAVRACMRDAVIHSFEPLAEPCGIFRKVFAGDDKIFLHQAAIGLEKREKEIHVSMSLDSSSLLPITKLQNVIYPGTCEKETRTITVETLPGVIDIDQILSPALLKLDVQGYELEALKGAEKILGAFKYVYAECSYVELYEGQALADEVISYLRGKGFGLYGDYNSDFDANGNNIQSDLLFVNENGE
jgi:FkbM family methyltransferase